MRPDFVTNEDVARWDESIQNDERVPAATKDSAVFREVMYAGLWLTENLVELGCPLTMAFRIQYTAAKESYGNDIWAVHQEILDDYKNDRLEFEAEPDECPTDSDA